MNLAQTVVGLWDPTACDDSPGRRVRVFAGLVKTGPGGAILERDSLATEVIKAAYGVFTYQAALDMCAEDERAKKMLGDIQLRDKDIVWTDPWSLSDATMDPNLHFALQDLADEVNEDVHEACAAFNDQDVWYPGVDEGIPPVSDDHVRVVIAALQRELDRELRYPIGKDFHTSEKLPAPPLRELPWNVQRALTERRRLRFQQYGIDRQRFLDNSWSLWEVPEDKDWVPRRQLRLRSMGKATALAYGARGEFSAWV